MVNYIYDGFAHVSFDGTTDTVFAIIANITFVAVHAIGLMPTTCRILKKGSTEKFHPYPYMLSLLNCMVWQYYAKLSEPENGMMPFRYYCLFISTIFGYMCSSTQFYFFFGLTTGKKQMIMGTCLPIFIGLCTFVFYSMSCWEPDVITDIMIRERLLTPICIAFGIAFYASPLSITYDVYTTKSVEFLPFWLCFANVLNGLAWVIYACASARNVDSCILITNGIGMVLGIIQLHLFYQFNVSAQMPNTSRYIGSYNY